MLHSFMKHNSWFSGHFIIIYNDLSDEAKHLLKFSFEKIELIPVSDLLDQQLNKLVRAYPAMDSKRARFYSVELFQITQFDKVLFCDSDLLFTGNIKGIFSRANHFLCTGDAAYYRGNHRDPKTFSETKTLSGSSLLSNTFNAGFMCISKAHLNQKTYTDLLTLISVETWEKVTTEHTDQLIYNLYFSGQQTLIDISYNYLLMHDSLLSKHTRKSIQEVKSIHFNGPAKPWKPNTGLHTVLTNANQIYAQKIWHEALHNYLSATHLKNQIYGQQHLQDSSYKQ